MKRLANWIKRELTDIDRLLGRSMEWQGPAITHKHGKV